MRVSAATVAVVCLGFVTGCGPSVLSDLQIHKPIQQGTSIVVAQFVVERLTVDRGFNLWLPDDSMVASVNQQASALVKALNEQGSHKAVALREMPAGIKGFECDLSYQCPTGAPNWRTWEAPAKETRQCELKPATARALASAHGVDMVMTVFSTWEYGLGFSKTGIVNTSFKVYSKDGELLVAGTYGGKRSLGAFPGGQSMIDQYTEAAIESMKLVATHIASGAP
jgi:hypothetical protein